MQKKKKKAALMGKLPCEKRRGNRGRGGENRKFIERLVEHASKLGWNRVRILKYEIWASI